MMIQEAQQLLPLAARLRGHRLGSIDGSDVFAVPSGWPAEQLRSERTVRTVSTAMELETAVQDDRVSMLAARTQKHGGRLIVRESIAAGQPRRHQERHRHRPGVELLAEFVDVRNGAVSYARDRHDQLSRHTLSVSTAGVGTVSYTPTAGVEICLKQGGLLMLQVVASAA